MDSLFFLFTAFLSRDVSTSFPGSGTTRELGHSNAERGNGNEEMAEEEDAMFFVNNSITDLCDGKV